MVKTIVISIVLLAFALVALGVKVLFVKNGKFPSGHARDIARRKVETRFCASARQSSAANPAKNDSQKSKR